MHCCKCGKEIKRGSKFCKYCGTKQCSFLEKSLHFIYVRLKKCEKFIKNHMALIVVTLLLIIITLQVISIIINTDKPLMEKQEGRNSTFQRNMRRIYR